MNLVAECRTIAAPRSCGCWSTGVANVLSTSTGTSPAAATTARMSTRSSDGFAGDSTITRPVSGRIAAAISAASAKVTSVPSRPIPSRWSVPPYSGRTATTCGVPRWTVASRTALSAAIPEANARASSVCSSSATADSRRATVGFHSRWYTGDCPGSSLPPVARFS